MPETPEPQPGQAPPPPTSPPAAPLHERFPAVVGQR